MDKQKIVFGPKSPSRPKSPLFTVPKEFRRLVEKWVILTLHNFGQKDVFNSFLNTGRVFAALSVCLWTYNNYYKRSDLKIMQTRKTHIDSRCKFQPL